MLACLTEDFAEQFGCAVNDGGLSGEVHLGCHEADNLHDALHAVQVANDGLDRCQGVEQADTRVLLRILGGHEAFSAGVGNLTGFGQSTLNEGQLTGGVHVGAGRNSRNVGCNGGGCYGQFVTEFADTCFNTGFSHDYSRRMAGAGTQTVIGEMP